MQTIQSRSFIKISLENCGWFSSGLSRVIWLISYKCFASFHANQVKGNEIIHESYFFLVFCKSVENSVNGYIIVLQTEFEMKRLRTF